MPETASSYAIYQVFGIFRFSSFVRFRWFKKCCRAIFALLMKSDLKRMYLTTQTHFLYQLFDLVTLNEMDLTQCHKGLGKVLRSIPDTIHVIRRLYFNMIGLLCPAKRAMTDI